MVPCADLQDRSGDTDGAQIEQPLSALRWYVIWDDRMWSAWDGFEPEPYLSSSCKKLKKCSKTLRHRDHVHVSLSRKGGYGRTSFYDGRVEKKKD